MDMMKLGQYLPNYTEHNTLDKKGITKCVSEFKYSPKEKEEVVNIVDSIIQSEVVQVHKKHKMTFPAYSVEKDIMPMISSNYEVEEKPKPTYRKFRVPEVIANRTRILPSHVEKLIEDFEKKNETSVPDGDRGQFTRKILRKYTNKTAKHVYDLAGLGENVSAHTVDFVSKIGKDVLKDSDLNYYSVIIYEKDSNRLTNDQKRLRKSIQQEFSKMKSDIMI